MIYDDAHVQLYLRVETPYTVPALPKVELFAIVSYTIPYLYRSCSLSTLYGTVCSTAVRGV